MRNGELYSVGDTELEREEVDGVEDGRAKVEVASEAMAEEKIGVTKGEMGAIGKVGRGASGGGGSGAVPGAGHTLSHALSTGPSGTGSVVPGESSTGGVSPTRAGANGGVGLVTCSSKGSEGRRAPSSSSGMVPCSSLSRASTRCSPASDVPLWVLCMEEKELAPDMGTVGTESPDARCRALMSGLLILCDEDPAALSVIDGLRFRLVSKRKAEGKLMVEPASDVGFETGGVTASMGGGGRSAGGLKFGGGGGGEVSCSSSPLPARERTAPGGMLAVDIRRVGGSELNRGKAEIECDARDGRESDAAS